ncbi:hypothetical protein H0H93_009773, partial [Arthromyces matolae]
MDYKHTPEAIQPLDAPVSLPLTKRLNLGSLKNLVQRDRLRAKTLRARAEAILGGNLPLSISLRDEISAEVTNSGVSYSASVGVGSPPTTYNLLVDTGSSNTWVGSKTPYIVTSTSLATKGKVVSTLGTPNSGSRLSVFQSVTYGSGSFSGSEYLDTVTLSPDLVLQQQSIGVASTSQGLDDNDGILGIGPTDLTLGTLSPDTQATIPTVVDTAAAQGLITANAVGVYFEPITSSSQGAGELSYGGANKEKYIGEMAFAPLTTTAPANLYWGIDQTIMYGGQGILDSAGIVDTGSTLVLIATDAFQHYQSLTGAVLGNNTGLLRITPAQFAKLKPLEFIIEG